jgi:hypothetical protein
LHIPFFGKFICLGANVRVSWGQSENALAEILYRGGHPCVQAGQPVVSIVGSGRCSWNSGATFKGKRELERDGQTNTREFEAKRSKE